MVQDNKKKLKRPINRLIVQPGIVIIPPLLAENKVVGANVIPSSIKNRDQRILKESWRRLRKDWVL